jgi:hypothetical protein
VSDLGLDDYNFLISFSFRELGTKPVTTGAQASWCCSCHEQHQTQVKAVPARDTEEQQTLYSKHVNVLDDAARTNDCFLFALQQ